jgi:hypothetical protein
LPPWQELYDLVKHDVVSTTSNASLNGKLYAKLLLSLEGIASQNIISRTHLRANGVLLLRELVQTYCPNNVPEVIAAKTSQFWGQTKRLPNESIDTYYNRFHELLQELLDGEERFQLGVLLDTFFLLWDLILKRFKIIIASAIFLKTGKPQIGNRF